MSDITPEAVGTAAPAARPAVRRRRPDAELMIGLLVLFAFALFPLTTLLGVSPYFESVGARIMIFAIAAISLDFILGYGAMVSFGHAAFLGLGGYAVGILAHHGISDLVLQLVVAVLVSSLFALVTGAISLRTKGVYFIMITLAFGQMAFFFMVSLAAYGGDDGLTIDGRSTLLGFDVLSDDRVFYYVVLVFLAASFFLTRAMVASRFGRVIRGTRDNPVRMTAIGFSPYPFQLAAYVIAGAMAGVAGVLLANATEFVAPAYMAWQRSGELIIMVVLGGMGTVTGGMLGATVLLLLEEWLPGFSQHWKIALGVILILLVLYARGGLVAAVRRLLPAREGGR